MEDFKTIACGGLAGAIGFTATLPLDYIKQHIQSGKVFSDIKKKVSRNGIKELFRGGSIGLKVIVPQMAIKYYSFHTLNKILPNPVISSFGAGFIDGLFLGPPLMIQALMQTNSKLSYNYCKDLVLSKNIIKYCFPMAMRNAFYTSSILGLGSVIKNKNNIKTTPLNDFIIAMALNPIGVLLCSPWDVIRAKQAYNLAHQNSSNIRTIVKEIIKREGYRGFYHGGLSLFINFALRFPLTFAINTYLLREFI